ncbi:MAG: hypothetical protein SGPRY_011146, partial [Prymnesium sp.]
MVGFIAEAESEELQVNEEELDGAGWFEASFVREQLELQGSSDMPAEPGAFHVPSRISLARCLIDTWLKEQA